MIRMLYRLMLSASLLSACASNDEPQPTATTAAAPDRPLDGYLPDPRAARAAMLIESALAQVRPQDLRRCIAEFQGPIELRYRLPAHGRWLIVADARSTDDASYARRREAAPEAEAEPVDGWLDHVVYRTLLRSTETSGSAVACLSCVFDYEGASLVYRHAYALDTCHRAVPPERDLVAVVPLG